MLMVYLLLIILGISFLSGPLSLILWIILMINANKIDNIYLK